MHGSQTERGLHVDVDLMHFFLQTLCLQSFFASVCDEALVHGSQTERGLRAALRSGNSHLRVRNHPSKAFNFLTIFLIFFIAVFAIIKSRLSPANSPDSEFKSKVFKEKERHFLNS